MKYKNFVPFFFLALLALPLGCIQQGGILPPPPTGKQVKVIATPTISTTIQIGSSEEYSLDVTNNYPKAVEDVKAYVTSPDVVVSISDKLLDFGTIDAGDTASATTTVTLGSNAIAGKEYRIAGRLCFSYSQEGWHDFIVVNESKYATGITPSSDVEDGPLTITFSGVDAPVTKTTFKPVITIANEANGKVSSKGPTETGDSILSKLTITISDELIDGFSVKIDKEVFNATCDATTHLCTFETTNSTLLDLEAEEQTVYLTVNVKSDKLTTEPLIDQIRFTVEYGYCIDLPTSTFTAAAA